VEIVVAFWEATSKNFVNASREPQKMVLYCPFWNQLLTKLQKKKRLNGRRWGSQGCWTITVHSKAFNEDFGIVLIPGF